MVIRITDVCVNPPLLGLGNPGEVTERQLDLFVRQRSLPTYTVVTAINTDYRQCPTDTVVTAYW